MPENVLADAQYSLAAILKPFEGFEAIYQGQASDTPVVFYAPDDSHKYPARDADAGRPGFSPDLLRFMSVPLGARVLIWVPALIMISDDVVVQTAYQYRIHWRLRSVTDFRNRRIPFHLSQQFPGAADTFVNPAQQRFVLPSATRTVVINQTEAAATGAQVENLRREFINYLSNVFDQIPLPLLPDGVPGVYEQGIIDPNTVGGVPGRWGQSVFMPFWCDAEGDEMLIEAVRAPGFGTDVNWNFNSTLDDAAFSNYYGTNVIGPTHPRFPGVGIYVMLGASLSGSTPRTNITPAAGP